MSTVIGSCTDCIISVPVVPTSTLGLKGNLFAGQGLVLKNLMSLSPAYDASAGLVVQDFTIAASGSLDLPVGTTALVLNVKGSTFLAPTPLQLTLTKTVGMNTSMYEVTVNQVYVSDDALTTISIANPSTTAAVSGTIAYVPAA
jgi:hypothetical protein